MHNYSANVSTADGVTYLISLDFPPPGISWDLTPGIASFDISLPPQLPTISSAAGVVNLQGGGAAAVGNVTTNGSILSVNVSVPGGAGTQTGGSMIVHVRV